MGAKSQLVHNFSAGPGALPKKVIERVRNDFPNWNGTGMSITEISHRSKDFIECASKAENNLRSLLNVPDDYHVLFLQGGATLQFSMIPMNLGEKNSLVDYVVTGSWGNKAVKEAKKYKHVNIASDSVTNNYTSINDENTWSRSEVADYIHITSNETIAGVEYNFVPETGNIPLVSDISSTILSRPLEISKFGLVYAGAQKNIGPAGLTIVIVRKDLINDMPKIPALLNYHNYIESQSMYNTPPVFSWYVAGLVFEYLLDYGGLKVIEEINKEKSKLLYDFVDNSEFYSNPVDKKCRSRMNIPFLLKDNSLNELFLAKSLSEGLANLKGHRSVGGMRASIYNATGIDAVRDLIDFMKGFENKFG